MKTDRSAAMIVSLTMCMVLTIFSLAWSEELRVGAGAAPTENILKPIQEPMEKSIGLKLVIVSNGPVEALKELDKGTVDAATGGLSFSDWMALMKKEGYKVADEDVYRHREIGVDSVRLILHKDIRVRNLSKADMKGIFTGRITNWKEVGGPELPVKVILGTKIPGTLSFFQKGIMDGEAYIPSAVEATTAIDVKEKIAVTPGSIGVGPASVVDIFVGNQGLPIAGRPITIITKGAPSPAVMKMLNYINGEGRQYVYR